MCVFVGIIDVPNTTLILRKHTLPMKLFSCLLFNELAIFNPRDQLPFGYVRETMTPKVKIHMFESTIFNTITNDQHSYKFNQIIAKEPPLDLHISLGYEYRACKSYSDRMWAAYSVWLY